MRLRELDSSTSNLKAASETFSSFLSVHLLQDLFRLSAESTIRKEVSVLSAGVDPLYSAKTAQTEIQVNHSDFGAFKSNFT